MIKKIFQRLFLSPAERRYDDAYTQAKRIVGQS